jgi:hypothetical protein
MTKTFTRFGIGLAFVALIAGSIVAVVVSANTSALFATRALEIRSVETPNTGLTSANIIQNVLTGEWTGSIGLDDDEKTSPKDSNKIHLNLELRSDGDGRRGRHQSGQSYDFAELQGLSREQVIAGGAVRFSLVREAGTIDFEGSFQNRKGSGTFRFTPNQNFVGAMKSRGFDFEADSGSKGPRDLSERLFTATTVNVTTALADDLASAGFGKLTVEDLFKAAIFKIDSKFMREMKATGFGDMGMEELVKARIFKIDADYVQKVSQMGFDKEPFESLVKMRIFKVTPEFLVEIRNEGLTNVTIEDLVKMRIFKIDGEYIRRAKAEGVPLEVERLVERKIHSR